MLAPLACATGTRQLFTSMPSKSTEHEPHSPSPHPSFVPVNSRLTRSTSSNLSMGWASAFLASPLTVNETSHFAFAADEGFMTFLSPEKERLVRGIQAAAEWNRSELQSHLPRH